MKGKIIIRENTLSYVSNISVHKYAYFKVKPFKININDIRIIAVYRTLILDDESDFFVIVDEYGKKKFIPISDDLDGESFLSFLDYFKINNYKDIPSEWHNYE